jgi:hypothetical protein
MDVVVDGCAEMFTEGVVGASMAHLSRCRSCFIGFESSLASEAVEYRGGSTEGSNRFELPRVRV